jgi:hypothetical protein
MIGTIRRRDLLAHPVVTMRCCGWRVFLKALVAGRRVTFLSLLADTKRLQPPTVKVPEFVGRCIALELQAKWIYEWLAGRFIGYDPVREFFETLAHQEETHAELLKLCREVASRAVWKEECFSQWRDAVPRLEQQMADIESSLGSLNSVSDGLWIVIQIEGSEVNQVFEGVVAASGSPFVQKVRAFQHATEDHISYICDEIPKLEPDLAKECRELRDRFFVRAS